jgi:hypothetical protein
MPIEQEGQAAQGMNKGAATGKTNQDMINVLYKAAKELGMAEWTLIQKVKLTNLTDDRSAAYSGPAPADMPGIDEKQKAVIQKVLENYKRPEK